MEFIFGLLLGLATPEWGHFWIEPNDSYLYATRSLSKGSALCVTDYSGKILCEVPTGGRNACHVAVLGHQAVVSDYSGGTLTIFELDDKGFPEGQPEVIAFPARHIPEGETMIDRKRQKTPHIHSAWLSPDGNTLVVVDLGSDKLYLFPVRNGRISGKWNEKVLPDGCGPRHCSFAHGQLYVATELSDEVLVLSWPDCKLLQSILVNDVRPRGGSHLEFSKDGKFLYVSSRLKNDGIGIFSVGKEGMLKKVGYQPTGGHPRHFSLSNDGSELYVACRDSDTVEIFERNRKTGLLKLKEKKNATAPVFVKQIK